MGKSTLQTSVRNIEEGNYTHKIKWYIGSFKIFTKKIIAKQMAKEIPPDT